MFISATCVSSEKKKELSIFTGLLSSMQKNNILKNNHSTAPFDIEESRPEYRESERGETSTAEVSQKDLRVIIESFVMQTEFYGLQ